MTCEECEQILLDWMLGASRAALLQAHVQNCPACTTSMAEVAKMQGGLDDVRVSAMHMEAPAAVEKNLLAAFRRETAKRRLSVGHSFLWRPVWVALATLVLTAAGIWYSRFRPDSLVKVESNKIGSKVVIEPPFSPGLSRSATQVQESRRSAPADGVISGGNSAKAVRRVPEPVVRPAAIPASDELSLNGGGSIVRVTLPFSSLTAMGLPVRPDLSDTRVTADVWMDPFGAVMGIRLVPAKASTD